jgi:prepilin-type N-terminal cleavage/methylation domain-containing protein
MKSRRPKPGDTGFTLIEIVFSITILTVGITAILGSFNGMLETHRLMTRRTEAMFHAREVLAAVRMKTLSPTTEEPEGEFEGTDYRYRVVFSASEWPNLYQVSITIEWGEEERAGDIMVYTLQYYG